MESLDTVLGTTYMIPPISNVSPVRLEIVL
jgi:hypothetical protein